MTARDPLPELKDPPGSFLFSDDVIERLTDQERKYGIYTADRLPEDKRKAIIKLLGENRQVRDIATFLRVAPETITAVANHPIYSEQITHAITAPILARTLRRCAAAQLERLDRCPDLLPASSIPFATSVFIDKAELLDGKATARIEHTTRVDIFQDYDRFLAELETEYEQKTAPGIHSCAEKLPAIEAELVERPAIADRPDPAAAEVPGCNSKLQVSEVIHPANELDATTKCYELEPKTGEYPVQRELEAAGGGFHPARPPDAATDSLPQNFWPNGSFTSEVESDD